MCIWVCVLFVDKQHLHVFYTFYWDMCHNPLFFIYFFFLKELVNQTDIQEIGVLPASFWFAMTSSWWLPERLPWKTSDCQIMVVISTSDCQIMVVISTSEPSLPFSPFLTGHYPCFLRKFCFLLEGNYVWPCCLLSLVPSVLWLMEINPRS